ncbi:MAG: penicillin-binding protein 2 [Rickettsiales bacterium]
MSLDKTTYPARISILVVFFCFLYAVLCFKIFNVAVFFEEEVNARFLGSEISKRKDIVDRNGVLLATNLTSVSVYANPKKIENIRKTAKRIAKALPDIRLASLEKKLRSNKSFIWIKRNISPKEQQRVNNLGLPGVFYEINEKRAYPYGRLFSHILGYVGLDGNGLAGIEKQYDEELKSIKDEKDQIQLTLDARIQNIAREELGKGIKKFKAKGGAAIVQDPKTGEIISLVSLPDYDPHIPGKASDEQMFNKSTLASYELGSVFKIFTVAMALDRGTTDVKDAYDVSKPIQFAKYSIKDFRGKGGFLSVPEILMYSSNIGTVQIAFELGADHLYGYLKSLGFLSKVKIDYPEISSPIYPNRKSWGSTSTATVSYGYGVSASPLQVIRAFNAVVNGGYLRDSMLVKQEHEKLPAAKKVFSDDTSLKLRKILNMVVQKGSGKKAKVAGYYVGGKSGTANKAVNGKYNSKARMSSFLSAFPIHDPKYSIFVILDDPQGIKETFGFATGGWNAAPITSSIIRRIATIENIPTYDDKEIDEALKIEYDTGKKGKYL